MLCCTDVIGDVGRLINCCIIFHKNARTCSVTLNMLEFLDPKFV